MHVPSIKNLGWMFLFLMMGGIYNMALTSFFIAFFLGFIPLFGGELSKLFK